VQELAEAKAQLESKKSSLESARRQLDHNKADLALQNALAKDRDQLGEGRGFISDRTLDQVHANADIAKADLGVAEANRDLAANQVDVRRRNRGENQDPARLYADRGAFRRRVGAAPGETGVIWSRAATATRTTPSAGSLFTLQRNRHDHGVCDVPENDVPHLHVGDPAIVRAVWPSTVSRSLAR